MFERLAAFLRDLPGAGKQQQASGEDDPRIAAAALMFHVIDADGVRSKAERIRLEEVLSRHFGVAGSELQRLIRAGEKADREAIDLYAFTSVLKRSLDLRSRVDFIRIMWEIVYADGERHELEDNLVWRIAELIGVERADRLAMRRSVEAGTDGESQA
jgi:uncharacterized tellurite resistance protein B-like protein